MAQIILVKNTFTEQAKLEAFLRQEMNLDLIVKDSIKDVLLMLRILPDVQAVILPEIDTYKKQAVEELKIFCTDNELVSSLMITDLREEQTTDMVFLPFLNKKIRFASHSLPLSEMKRILKVVLSGEALGDDREYFSVSFALIYSTLVKCTPCSFPFNLSFCIKKEDENNQYVLRFRKEEPIDLNDFEKYKNQKNAKYLFVNTNEKASFDSFFNNIKQQNSTVKVNSFEQRIYSAELTSQVLRNHFASFGMDEKGKELVEEYFQHSMMALKDTGAFSLLLKHFFSKTSSYQYVHSMALALVLNKVTHKLGWDSPSFKEKVAFICLMHDLCLVDDELTHIESEAELNSAELTDVQKTMAMNHALKISTLIADYKDRAIGVEEVLREHHGMKNGIGYARELNFHLHHLSMAFITTQHFIHEFLKLENPSKTAIQDIIASMGVVYNKGFYAKAYEALKEVFK